MPFAFLLLRLNMTKTDTILYEALVNEGRLGREILEPLAVEAQAQGEPLASLLLRRALIPEQDILKILSRELNIPYLDLKSANIAKTVIDKISLKIAAYYKFMPVELHNRALTAAVAYPLDVKIQDEIRTQLGYDLIMVLAISSDIKEALKKHYGLGADTLGKIGASVINERGRLQSVSLEAVEDIEKQASDASVINLVNQIILEGWKKRATDIHIEPFRGGVNFRYRIDGLLYDASMPAQIKNFLSAIISRIKIMSNLNIVERRLPQDGRSVVKVQDQVLDLRISTIPTPFGESIVIRILPSSMLFSLEKLGLPKKYLQTFETLIQKPHGIIFVTGPTGSGKTTTLYSCLSRINTRERKIITIEDPIEYEMSGITQIQVAPEIGLDFARGLRSILRHDPDVIMVGEVRDLETAETAIRVALTGHLVFSTLHTNDAVSGITRLTDIGVEPYLISSSVEAFIAQRLIRVICPDCRYEDKSAPVELKNQISQDLGLRSQDVRVYRGKGCNNCNSTGFFGRTAIYEVLLADDTIKDLILKKAPANHLKRIAVSKGMQTLRQDGWQKVVAGITTPEEVMKATPVSETASFVSSGSGELPPGTVALEPGADNIALSDKRIFTRLDNKVNLIYKILEVKDGLVKRGFTPEQFSVTRNISAGGLVFISEEPLAIGAVLELKIELPNEPPIDCLSRVVRVEERQASLSAKPSYDTAICFLDIAGSQRSQLNKYIEQINQ